jgi:hypothetical protein
VSWERPVFRDVRAGVEDGEGACVVAIDSYVSMAVWIFSGGVVRIGGIMDRCR